MSCVNYFNSREEIEIFAETHKIMSVELGKRIFQNSEVELNINKLQWGSIIPDFYPKYRLIRHYSDESLDFIVNEIVSLIYMSRYINFERGMDKLTNKYFSTKLGIISHYLSDYFCLPHFDRWTFGSSMRKHVKYEKDLAKLALDYEFKKGVINASDINVMDMGTEKVDLKKSVKEYIETVLTEYSQNKGYESDLNYAVDLSSKIACFVIETANCLYYIREKSLEKVFVF